MTWIFILLVFGTDGIDGNSQAAGGVVNQQMLMRITQQGLRISKYLTKFMTAIHC